MSDVVIKSMAYTLDGVNERRYVALAGDELVGVASVANVGRAAATLFQLFVAATWRGQGVGTALVEVAERDARAAGSKGLSAIVGEGGPFGFYGARGYEAAHCEGRQTILTKRLVSRGETAVDAAIAAVATLTV